MGFILGEGMVDALIVHQVASALRFKGRREGDCTPCSLETGISLLAVDFITVTEKRVLLFYMLAHI